MRILATGLLALSWTCAAAQETSLLERLSAETQAIVKRAQGAVLPITKLDGRVGPRSAAITALSTYYESYRLEWPDRPPTIAAPGLAVRVSDRLLLVTYEQVGKARRIGVEIDGREVTARRVDANADLGIAVYELPEEERRPDAPFVRPEKRWEPLRRGSIAVLVGPGGDSLVGLALISRCEWHKGEIAAFGPLAPLPLFGPGGSLLGLRRGEKATRSVKITDMLRPPVSWAATSHDLALAYHLLQPHEPEVEIEDAPLTYLAGPALARIVVDIEQHGRIRVGYLGVVVADAHGAGDRTWCVVSATLASSPARAAGLEAGMRIAAVDGKPCTSAGEFSRAIALKRPGDPLELELAPDGRVLRLVLADREQARVLVTPELLGLECMELTADLRAFLDVGPELAGVVARKVRPESPAAAAGIRAGDVILSRDEHAIGDLEALEAALATARGLVRIRFWREGATHERELEIPETGPGRKAR